MKLLKNKKTLLGIIGIVAVIGAIIAYATLHKATMEVEVQAVTEGPIEKYVEEISNIKVKQQEMIYANLSGKVSEVLVEVGDQVKKGDILAKLDSENQARDISILEAQKAALRAEYNEALKPADQAAVKKLELSIGSLEKQHEETKLDLERQKALLDSGVISSKEYQDFLLKFDSEQTELDKTKLDLELLKKPVSANVSNQFKAQLAQLDLQIEALQSNEGDLVFSAPFDGTLLSKDISEGTYIQVGMPILEVGNLQELYAEADVLVDDITDIKEGTEVKLENEDLGIRDIKGFVSKIYPQAESKVSDLGVEQKRIKVEIRFDKQLQGLRPGYDLTAKFITDKNPSTKLIPENALFQIEGKDYVFVSEKNTAALRQIEKGIESDRMVEVKNGLNIGDKVICSPDEKLEEGMALKERNFDN